MKAAPLPPSSVLRGLLPPGGLLCACLCNCVVEEGSGM